MHRLFPLAVLFAACQPDDVADAPELLPADEVAPPVVMDLYYEHDLIKGRPTTVTVSGGPANRPINLLATAQIGGAPACPAVFAPDCLDLANPFVVLGNAVADATGTATFQVTVPVAAPVVQARLQAAAIQGRTHFLSDAPVVDVVAPPTATTIPDIRSGAFPVGTFVEVTGVVNAVRNTGFSIQTQGATNAGLFVYTFVAPGVAIGDRVTVTGDVLLYDNNGALTTPAGTLLEVAANVPGGTWTVTSSGPPPAPITASMAQLQDPVYLEQHECMVVRLDEAWPLVVITDPHDPAQFDEFRVAQAPGGTSFEIDNEFFNLPTTVASLSVGDSFDSLSGVIFFSFDEYKLAIRGQADVAGFIDVP